jgi:hypothetical protein
MTRKTQEVGNAAHMTDTGWGSNRRVAAAVGYSY